MIKKYSSFEVYAPGKVILSGEHAVVYQKDALSIGIDKYTKLSCNLLQCLSNENNFCYIDLRDINNSFIIEKEKMISLCVNHSFKYNNTLAQYKEFIKNAFGVISEIKEHFVMMIVIVANYFFNKKIENNDSRIDIKKDFIQFIKGNIINIKISSEIPLGNGLGSSSAYDVAIVNCFIFIFKNVVEFTDIDVSKDDLISLANFGEQYFHITPSGIDVTTCVHGGLVHFIKLNDYNLISNHQSLFDNFNVMIINTGKQRIAKEFIIKVSQYKAKHNDDFLKAMNSIQEIALKIKAIITDSDPNNNSPHNCNHNDYICSLSKLIIENQRLLKQIQVSNDTIDHICSLLENKGIPAKITGAGGGGFIIALVSSNKIETFEDIMNENKYSYFKLNPSIKGSFIQTKY